MFSRTEGSTKLYPLTDALGSVIAFTDATGTLQTQYTYQPYGQSARTGTATSNAQTFTGREDDSGGLMYYRARYYHPVTGRFITEDPIGLAGGINLYAYVDGNPLTYSDPFGLAKGDALFGLPKKFWNWYHRKEKEKGAEDLTKAQADELHEQWVKEGKPGPDNKGQNSQSGFIDPAIGEILIPWWAFSKGLGGCDASGNCSDMIPIRPKCP